MVIETETEKLQDCYNSKKYVKIQTYVNKNSFCEFI